MCPLGTLAFFLHYIHDCVYIDEKYDIDHTSNKSWWAVRLCYASVVPIQVEHVIQIRLIHGSSAMVPYHETALQNLFVQSYKKAGVDS